MSAKLSSITQSRVEIKEKSKEKTFRRLKIKLHNLIFFHIKNNLIKVWCLAGEWLPEHVGIPVAEHGESSYYMLEVHYNNPSMKRVKDSSGIRIYLTPKLRPQEASILVTGVAVSPLHVVPPKQKEYATAGYCTPHCTETVKNWN